MSLASVYSHITIPSQSKHGNCFYLSRKYLRFPLQSILFPSLAILAVGSASVTIVLPFIEVI